jgi:hypothetical protein
MRAVVLILLFLFYVAAFVTGAVARYKQVDRLRTSYRNIWDSLVDPYLTPFQYAGGNRRIHVFLWSSECRALGDSRFDRLRHIELAALACMFISIALFFFIP